MEPNLVPVYISASPPAGTISKGSLWFNPSDTKMYVRVLQPGGGQWVEAFNTPGDVPFVYVSSSPPTSPVNGTLWYKPSPSTLKVWVENGTQENWVVLMGGSSGTSAPATAFVSTSPPPSPTQGTLWFNPIPQTLSVWVGPSWEIVSGSPTNKPSAYISTTAPGNPVNGDLWWNPLLKELRVWKISPTGDIWELITDNTPTTPTPLYTSPPPSQLT
jgi:hypothetical protein